MSNYCYNCLKNFEGEFCPACGFKVGTVQPAPMLPFNTMLAGRYSIGKCVRTDADSYTYMAYDASNGTPVQVTEFFVHNIMSRGTDGLKLICRPDKTDLIGELADDFNDMATKLQKLSADDKSIGVIDIFKENNTIYYVSRFEDCPGLVDVVDALRKNGAGYWDKLIPLFDMLISELEILHLSGLVHRGIGPKTVLISSDATIRLTGFSVASARINGKGTEPVLSREYAAPEQFIGSPYPDRTSDIYSVCALIFRCATGRVYDKEKMSMASVFFSEDVPVYAVNAILKGLNADPEQRFGSMMELRNAINGERTAPEFEPENSEINEKADKPRATKVRFVLGMTALFTVLLVGLVIAALYFVFDINIFNPVATSSQVSSGHSFSIPSQASSQATVAYVPDLLGLEIDDVKAEYGENEKFTLQIEMSSEFNNVYPRNTVMQQSPEAGTPSPGLTTIVITVSRGPANIVMPAILGRPLDEVYDELTNKGLSVYLVEVDESYGSVLAAKGSGLTFKTGIVLDSPTAAGDIVKAESAVAIYGAVDRNPSGSYGSVTENPDGTATAVLTPSSYTVSDTVSVATYEDGSKNYYIVGTPYTVSYTTSYTYGALGIIVSKEQVFDPVPSNGTVSDSYDYLSGTTTRVFTPNPQLISGSVTESVVNGVTVYTVQPNPVTVKGTVEVVTYPDGSTSKVFTPEAAPGELIPTAKVTTQTDPITGAVTYTIIPD